MVECIRMSSLGYRIFPNKITLSHCISFIKSNVWCKLALKERTFATSSMKLSSVSARERMKAWQTETFDGVEGIHLSSVRLPVILKPSEVLIKVSAASVNPIDIAVLDGYGKNIYADFIIADEHHSRGRETNQSQLSLTVGRDFVGEVVRVGQSFSKVKVDDHVWGVVLPQRQGSHAEYVVTESYNICPKPESVTDVEAASIPYVGLTSWSAAVVTGGLVPNDCYGSRVLVIGASGGIGTFLTQMLSLWGAEVVGICCEDAFELVLSCGVSEVHDYRNPETNIELMARPRFDLIIDAAGFNDVRWGAGLKEWNDASYVSLHSLLLKNADQDGLSKGLLKKFVQRFFIHMQQSTTTLSRGKFSKYAYFMPNQTALEEITKLVASRKIRPVIDKVFKLEDAKYAYEHVRDGPSRGKTVINFRSK